MVLPAGSAWLYLCRAQPRVYATLKQLDPEFKDVAVDLSKTFIDTFVKHAKGS